MIKKILIGILILGVAAAAAIFTDAYREAARRVAVAEKVWNPSSQSNPSGTIKIVEFIDYSCPYCHEFFPILEQATADNKNINIILRPLGVLNEDSKKIGAIILAAALQNKEYELHKAAMKLPYPFTAEQVFSEAERLGLDMKKLKEDATLDEFKILMLQNAEVHHSLGFRETPALLINGKIYVPNGPMPTPNDLKTIIEKY